MSQSSQYPPETISVTEGPEIGQTVRPSVPTKALNSDYPVLPPAYNPMRLPTLHNLTNTSLSESSSTQTPTSSAY
jgi:hypothetical protein